MKNHLPENGKSAIGGTSVFGLRSAMLQCLLSLVCLSVCWRLRQSNMFARKNGGDDYREGGGAHPIKNLQVFACSDFPAREVR